VHRRRRLQCWVHISAPQLRIPQSLSDCGSTSFPTCTRLVSRLRNTCALATQSAESPQTTRLVKASPGPNKTSACHLFGHCIAAWFFLKHFLSTLLFQTKIFATVGSSNFSKKTYASSRLHCSVPCFWAIATTPSWYPGN
jgi:hypothetical protein